MIRPGRPCRSCGLRYMVRPANSRFPFGGWKHLCPSCRIAVSRGALGPVQTEIHSGRVEAFLLREQYGVETSDWWGSS